MKPQPLERYQAVSPPAEQLDNPRIPRPTHRTQPLQSVFELANLLLGRFKSPVCGFPH
jgi:hypothetical protein